MSRADVTRVVILAVALALAETNHAQLGPGLGHQWPTTSRVWVVDAVGAGDFTEIQAAIDAASSGDTVVIKPGAYLPFEIVAKSLVLVGQLKTADDKPEVPTSTANYFIRVAGLDASQRVIIRGLAIATDQLFQSQAYGVHLENNAGPVWLEEVDWLVPFYGPPAINGLDGVLVEECEAVGLKGCQVYAGGFAATSGIRAFHSDVLVYGSTVMGGFGAPGSTTCCGPADPGGTGGPGVVAMGGALRIAHSAIHGGRGGNSPFHPNESGMCSAPGNGGDGIIIDGGAVVRYDSTSFVPGEVGAHVFQCSPSVSEPAWPGLASVVLDGSLERVACTSGGVDSPALFATGSPFVHVANVTELQATAFVLLVSSSFGALDPTACNALSPARPGHVVASGVTGTWSPSHPVPGSTTLFQVPRLPVGAEAATFLLHPVFVTPLPQSFVLGAPSAMTIVREGVLP